MSHIKGRVPINSKKTATTGEDEDILDESVPSGDEHNGSRNLTIGNTSSDDSMRDLYNNEKESRRRSPSIAQSRLYDPFNSKQFQPESYKETSGQSTNWRLGSFLVLAFLIVVSAWFFLPSATECKYEKLRDRYKQQDEKMWDDISITIENILKKRSKSPAVNLFVHQGGKDMQDLVREIAKETSKCFGKNLKLVEMEESDFTSSGAIKEYGKVIEKFKSKISKGKVAVIVNLNMIPAETARALHTICDTHTPIAEEIAIFLTLATTTANGNPIENAQNKLRELWGTKLERNELDALITRVTDQVFALK